MLFDARATNDESSGEVDASNCQTPTNAAGFPSNYADFPSSDWQDGEVWNVDLHGCNEEYRHVWLPLGSAWALVQPNLDLCRLWLGGETENPLYQGAPTQFCEFPIQNACVTTVALVAKGGGPVRLEGPGCIVLDTGDMQF